MRPLTWTRGRRAATRHAAVRRASAESARAPPRLSAGRARTALGARTRAKGERPRRPRGFLIGQAPHEASERLRGPSGGRRSRESLPAAEDGRRTAEGRAQTKGGGRPPAEAPRPAEGPPASPRARRGGRSGGIDHGQWLLAEGRARRATPAPPRARARAARRGCAPSVRPESGHERIALTAEMGAMGDYSGVMEWPPRRQPSCCQVSARA